MIDLPPKIWTPPKPAIIRAADADLVRDWKRADARRVRQEQRGTFPFPTFMPTAFPTITQTEISYIASGTSTGAIAGSPAIFTLSSVDFGAYHPQRIEAVVFSLADTAADVTGVTFGGVAGTYVVFALSTVNFGFAYNNSANAISGTSCDVVFTCSATDAAIVYAYASYRILAANSRTAYGSQMANGTSASTTAAANGVALMMAHEQSATIGNGSYSEDVLLADYVSTFEFRCGRVAPTSAGSLSTSMSGSAYACGVICWD